MALAEARAAWQRTANRCLVQEDAKRAPKLACCSSSVPPSSKPVETGPTNAAAAQDIPTSGGSKPFDRNSSYSNLSPNSRWWLQLQPNYPHQKGLTDENETCQIKENERGNFVDRENKDFTVKDEKCRSFYDINCQDRYSDELRDEVLVSCGVSKTANDQCFYPESSWIGTTEKNSPWWRTADTEELALLVSQRSHDLIENCDLPSPHYTYVKKDTSLNICRFSRDEISTSLTVRKPGIAARNSCHKLSMTAEEQSISSAGKPLRDRPTLERVPEMHAREANDDDNDASKAQLLQALRYSQTRAREAEEVAKQACAEKEHVVKLVFRQASQLFAYKQWLQLLQLENMYFQSKNNSNNKSHETVMLLPGKSTRTRKMRPKYSSRKRAKRTRPWYDIGKYAIVFALGMGLVGAGLLLGWTIGWMLPTW